MAKNQNCPVTFGESLLYRISTVFVKQFLEYVEKPKKKGSEWLKIFLTV
jgi:hypothetical protein